MVNKHPPKAAPVSTPTQGESSTADQTSSKEPTRAPVAEPPPDTDDFSDFGFSSSCSSSDELGSKINDLVAMVKSKVKKKKKKKRKYSEQESADEDAVVSEPIPKLKIRFGKQKSGSEEVSSSEETSKPTTDSPMKLTIKLGGVGGSPRLPPPPLLPPPPSLTLHKPSPVISPSSPKYEPAPTEDTSTVLKFKRCDVESGDEKPPIKLTLRVAQPMRNAKGWISPRTERLVNYIDNVTTFIDESVELSAKSDFPERTSDHSASVSPPSASPPAQAPPLPEPPALKPAPPSPSKRALNCKSAPLTTKIKLPSTAVTTACRKRKRESSPKHDVAVLTPKKVMEETRKPAVPPLKFRRSCLSNKVVETPSAIPENVVSRKPRNASASSSDTPTTKGPKSKKKKVIGSVVEEKEFWKCGIFSNTLKQGSRPLANDELDFRSNILPIYCGKQLVRSFVHFSSIQLLTNQLFSVICRNVSYIIKNC